jgi:hypothetical protein
VTAVGAQEVESFDDSEMKRMSCMEDPGRVPLKKLSGLVNHIREMLREELFALVVIGWCQSNGVLSRRQKPTVTADSYGPARGCVRHIGCGQKRLAFD